MVAYSASGMAFSRIPPLRILEPESAECHRKQDIQFLSLSFSVSSELSRAAYYYFIFIIYIVFSKRSILGHNKYFRINSFVTILTKFVLRGLTDVSVMRFGSVGASSPSRMSEPLLVLAVLHHGSCGFRHRAAASGLARCPCFQYSPVIGLLPQVLALWLVAFRLGQKDGQLSHDNRTISRFRQVRGHATGTHLLVRHPVKKNRDI